MPISDLRNVNYNTEEFRALVGVPYMPIFSRLMTPDQIQLISGDKDTTTLKYNLLDDSSATPTVRAEETNTINHYKFVGGSDKFYSVIRDGIISAKSGTIDATAHARFALRQELKNFDASFLVGADGNKGVLGLTTSDPLRLVLSGAFLLLPFYDAETPNFTECAKAAFDLGAAFRESIDQSSMASQGVVMIYGSDLKAWLSRRNTATDNRSLYDYFRDGINMPLAQFLIQDQLLAGSTIASANGISFIDNSNLEANVAGEFATPDLFVGQPEIKDTLSYDVIRITRGSVQARPTVEGGIVSATITIAAY